MTKCPVGLIGATSLVGRRLIAKLTATCEKTIAFSRNTGLSDTKSVVWRQLYIAPDTVTEIIEDWICVAPLWVLPACFPLLEAHGTKRIVALSSTSRFTKHGSSDAGEQEVARRLAQAEVEVQGWAEKHGVKWIILRPTLIYGGGRDKNITEIARFIRRFGFFPVFGKAQGLRQPIHADDVVAACLAALRNPRSDCRAYNISGGETITYREMVRRVFAAMGRSPRLLTVPMWAFRLSVMALQMAPRYRHWNVAMAERMNHDLVFDHGDVMTDLSFNPRPFHLIPEDLSSVSMPH